MASQEEDSTFHIDDICTSKSDQIAIGYIDRTHGEVESHVMYPANVYGKVHRHRAVPRKLYKEFLREGVPPKGYVLVQWQTESKAELVPCSDLVLLDRTFVSGDHVRQGDRSGRVISTRARCTLLSMCDVRELKSGKILKAAWLPPPEDEEPAFELANDGTMLDDVPASEIKRVHEYDSGDVIIYKDWIGRIKDCFDTVTIRLADGGVVSVKDDDNLKAVSGDGDERFSTGSLVRTKKGVLRQGDWVFGRYSPNTAPVGVVVNMRTTECQVDWLHHRIPNDGETMRWSPMPDSFLGPDELDSEDQVRVYDISRMPREPGSSTKSRSDPESLQGGVRVRFKDLAGASVKYDGSTPHGKLEKIDRMDTQGYDMNAFTITSTVTEADVLWNDGTMSTVRSTTIVPDPSVDDEDAVFHGDIVCTHETRTLSPGVVADWAITPAKVGIAEQVNSQERIAHVRWFKDSTLSFCDKDLVTVVPTTKCGTPGDVLEEVSFYDIRAPRSVNRDRGDYVLLPNLPGLQDENNPRSITWFGEVVDLSNDGKCTVRLGAAEPVKEVECDMTATIIALGQDTEGSDGHGSHPDADLLSYMGDSGEDGLGDSDFDMDDFEDEPWYDEGDIPIDDADDSWSTESEDNDHNGDTMSIHEGSPKAQREEPQQAPDTPASGPTGPNGNTDDAIPRTTAHIHSEELHLTTLPNAPPSYEILETTIPTNHHFASEGTALSSTHMKSVQKEHKILGAKGALPEGVYVRTWESRMDLIRVLFVGPAGTPYEYAPFMMDLYLPPHYPYEPPKAFFHSWTAEGAGMSGRVNPNLYEEGKICLSLLGTWQGDETRNEGWTPNKSTVLQVLVSILGLVLVKEPYYNEAGYEPLQGLSSSRQNSSAYTERTYLRARAFLVSPIGRLSEQGDADMVRGLEDVIKWLYMDGKGPRLLARAIDACECILRNSEAGARDVRQRDGLTAVTRGAALPLKRVTARLEQLAKGCGLGDA